MRRHTLKFFFCASLLILLSGEKYQALSQTSNDFVASNTTRINKGHFSSATQSNGPSQNAAMSDNARFVAFESTATNLIDESLIPAGVTDGRKHIYLYDRQANTLELVSVADVESESPNNEIPGDSGEPTVSNDGRYVAFTSSAPIQNIVEVGELNTNASSKNCVGSGCHVHIGVQGKHVYVRDRFANRTMLVSQVQTAAQVQLRENGVLKTVDENTTNTATVDTIPLFKNTDFGIRTSAAIIPSNNPRSCYAGPGGWYKSDLQSATSSNPRFSADGKYIIYETNANNLVVGAGTETNKCEAHYCTPSKGIDLSTGGVPGTLLGALSANAEDFIRNRNVPSNIQGEGNGLVVGEALGYGPTYFLQQNCYLDSNSVQDAVIRHGESNTNALISMFCKFYEPGQDCIPIAATRDVNRPDLSSDSSYIVFSSGTPFLESDFNKTEDVYVVERSKVISDDGTQTIEEIANLTRVSNNSSKITAANGASSNPVVSGNGRFVAYQSTATDVIPGDNNGKIDVYLFDRKFGDHVICSKSASGALGNGDSAEPAISSDGLFVSFQSNATNFGVGAGSNNIFLASVILDSSGTGRLAGCAVKSAVSNGTGTGGNSASTISDVGIALKTENSGTENVRVKRATVSYQTLANNLAKDADTNGQSDILQSPDCTALDLTTDTDGDGSSNCFDQCWKDATKVEDNDLDGDGIADCEDGCPTDSNKAGPQICGCGVGETDLDRDGTPDCKDLCPVDATKIEKGSCGCGVEETDLDKDGTSDCLETNPPLAGQTPTPTPTPNSGGGVVAPTPTTSVGGIVQPPLPAIVKIVINQATNRAKVIVSSTAPVPESNSTFEFKLRSVGRKTRVRNQTLKVRANGDGDISSKNAQVTFSGLTVGGRYAVKYRITKGGTSSEFSREKTFSVRSKR
jgi:hypothetical protein